MRRYTLLIALITISIRLAAQSAMNDWTIHPSFFTPQQIEEIDDYVFYTSNGYLFRYNKDTQETISFDRKQGLSDTDITLIRYDVTNDILFIAYSNSNIDLYQDGKIYNLPDLKDKVMSSSKDINQVTFYDNMAYLATDFGVMHLNLTKKEVSQTYDFGESIPVAGVYNDSIYVSFGDTLKSMKHGELRWFDNASWHDTGLTKITNMCELNGINYLLCTGNSTVLTQNGSTVTQLTDWIKIMKRGKESMAMLRTSYRSIYYFNSDAERELIVAYPEGTLLDDITWYNDDYILWVLDDTGISAVQKYPEDSDYITLVENSVYPTHNVDVPYHLAYSDGLLYVNNAGPNNYDENLFGNAYLSVLDDNGNWNHVLPTTDVPVTRKTNANSYGLSAIYDVLPIPEEPGSFYLGTWFEGMYKFNNFAFEKYYNENSESAPPYANSGDTYFSSSNYACKLNGQSLDSDGNLWMLYFNTGSDPAIHVKSPEDEWTTLAYNNLTSANKHYTKLLISEKYNLKWVVNSVTSDGSIFVFDDKGTIDDISDDDTRLFESFTDQDGTVVEGTWYTCAVEDHDGEIWVGCKKGLLVLNNLSNIFSSSYNCQRIKIARDDGSNYADILLDNITVTCIAVDGANRKWIGTQGGGLYLVSESGETIISHFTNSDSYLPSDNILSLALDTESGELYIGTDNGLVSYRTDATDGSVTYNNVYAYPNPIHANYNGVVTVTGLMENSLVKIFTVSGSQVFQGISNGGTITWDTCNAYGTKVQSGVYLVYASSSDGTQGVVTKILIMK